MRLSDEQIRQWSARGDPIHAWYSYQMIRDTLQSAGLDGLSYEVYAQGSYANKTNISGDSDVDLVIALQSAFYADKAELSAPERELYARYYQRSDLTWKLFRAAVTEALRSWYFVQENSKCVKVRSNLIRLPADVLIALDHRHYRSFLSPSEQTYVDGVQFFTAKNVRIVNFPKEHIRACAAKNTRVGGQFRPVVRVAKNARNRLVDAGQPGVAVGTAPSYFLESLLWNVADDCFRADLPQAYRNVLGWLRANVGDEKRLRERKLRFPNQMAELFGAASDSVWAESAACALISGLRLD